jgi:TolB-like protein/Tfp pilus assembly protein PilF
MSFIAELKRRNVIKVAAAYIIVGWLLMQIGEVMAPALHLPEWSNSFLAFIVILGFPIAMIFAWAFEMTPEGLKKEKDVDRGKSIAHVTGRKLDFAIIGLLVLALAYFAWDKFVVDGAGEEEMASLPAERGTSHVSAETPTDRKSIAVLPFANRSNVEDDLFFTDGIHDDLLTQLAKISDLKVISRTSVMNYRDTEKRIPEIAAELGVATILEGGVQRAGDRVRINAQLIDVTTDEHLWAETFDREMTVENLFDIQSEITRQIVAAVRGELSTAENQALSGLPTESLEAYEAYMHARAALLQSAYTAEKYTLAREWAKKAVALDPDFSWGWSVLAEATGHLIWIGFDRSEGIHKEMEKALNQALEIDPDGAESQGALGEYLYRIESDYPGAMRAFESASAQRPGDGYALFRVATTHRRMGKFIQAIAKFEEALQVDPLNSQTASDYLLTLWLNKEYEKAIQMGTEAIYRFPGDQVLNSHVGLSYIDGRGDLETARRYLEGMQPETAFEFMDLATTVSLLEREFEQALATWDLPEAIEFSEYRGSPRAWRGRARGEIYLLMGEEEKASEVLRAFIEEENRQVVEHARGRAFQLANVAIAHALLGETETAIDLADQAVAVAEGVGDGMVTAFTKGARPRVIALAGDLDRALEEITWAVDAPGTYLSRWTLALDPRWDFMRDDERFNALATPENGR